MSIAWKQTGDHRWDDGRGHSIIWQHGLGYCHTFGSHRRMHLPTLNAAKAWAETFDKPGIIQIIVRQDAAEAMVLAGMKHSKWFEVEPQPDGLWRISFKDESGALEAFTHE